MIFVALGTQKFQFNRLLEALDTYVDEGTLKEEIFAQIGTSDYKPRNYGYTDFMPADAYENMIEKCDLLITHAGVGTIMQGVEKNKPVIVCPRLQKYGEHVDDHQLEIADSFVELGFVTLCDENTSLIGSISKARNADFRKYTSERQKTIDCINDFLDNM